MTVEDSHSPQVVCWLRLRKNVTTMGAPLPSSASDGALRRQAWLRATTMLEVMIAITIMATALLAVFGHITNIRNLQYHTLAKELGAIAAANIANLYASTAARDIQDWQTAPSPVGPWIGDLDGPVGSWSTIEDLVRLRLLPPQNGFLEHDATQVAPYEVRFAVGMYRVLDNTDSAGLPITTQPGLWPPGTGMETVVARLHNPTLSLEDNRVLRAPSKIVTPLSEITPGNPVGVFVTVWQVDRGGVGNPRMIHSHFTSFSTPQ